MQKSNLFLTSGDADKKAYVNMMKAVVDEIAAAMDHTLCFVLEPDHITGKLVNEA